MYKLIILSFPVYRISFCLRMQYTLSNETTGTDILHRDQGLLNLTSLTKTFSHSESFRIIQSLENLP